MRIPEIRQRLRELAVEHDLPELLTLADELRRRKLDARAPIASKHMNDHLRADIIEYAKSHPDMTQFAIAEKFGVNQGRVSEALHGFRK